MIQFNDMDEIEENLWLGNLAAAENITELKSKGIKKILTVMSGLGPKYSDEEGFIHKKYDVIDFSGQNIIKYFGECSKLYKGGRKSISSLYGRSKPLCYNSNCIFNVD